MAYYYAKGKEHTHTNPTGLMVQIVKGELRKIGDWTTYATAPLDELTADDKQFVGWYWHNIHKETRYWGPDETKLALQGHKAELFDQLHAIYKNDKEFFHNVLCEKLEMVGLWGFEDEIKRREDVANHTPREVKYAIYDADDYGRTEGEPRGFATITTTGDPRADGVAAIRRFLARCEGIAEDEVMGIGFYNAETWTKYEKTRDAHIQGLRDQLDAALNAAKWA